MKRKTEGLVNDIWLHIREYARAQAEGHMAHRTIATVILDRELFKLVRNRK